MRPPSLWKTKPLALPEGWFVFEAGQSLVHLLWYVNAIHVGDLLETAPTVRRVYTEEHASFDAALTVVIQRIKAGDIQVLERSAMNETATEDV